MSGISGFFSKMRGRDREPLDAPKNISVLNKVSGSIPEDDSVGHSVRSLVAEALSDLNFDDAGIGCRQERFLTELIGQALPSHPEDPREIESHCKLLTGKALRSAINVATRYT